MLKKRISALFLAVMMAVASLASCATGNGVEQLPWNEYDALIENVYVEGDPVRRDVLLHLAEDMLMESECILPVYDRVDSYLLKTTVNGMYRTDFGAKYLMYTDTGDSDLKINLSSVPKTLDPAYAVTVSELTMVVNTFVGLYTYDADGNAVPELAEATEISEDGTTYTFTLKDGLVWSDGSRLGASDIAYAWRRVADPDTRSPYAYLLDVIAKDADGNFLVKTDETDTVLTVTLTAPNEYFLETCAFPALYPVKESAVEYAEGYTDRYGNILNGDAWTERNLFPTNGAYVVASYTASGQFTLTGNTRYWNNANVKTKTVTVMNLNPELAYESFTTGDYDLIDSVPLSVRESTVPVPEYHRDRVNSVYVICHNFNSNIYAGMTAENAAKLRRAISLYIDKEYIVRRAADNAGNVATSMIPGTLSDPEGNLFRQNDRYHRYPIMNLAGYYDTSTMRNREEALELLAELGLDADGDGVIDSEYKFTMKYLTVKNTRDIMIAQIVQQDLSEIGIIVEIKAVDEAVFEYEQMITKYDMITFTSSAYINDPLPLLSRWIADAKLNYANLTTEVIIENENAY